MIREQAGGLPVAVGMFGMSQAAKAQEPTMEEILASIRRIIADDDVSKSPAAPAKQPAAPAGVNQQIPAPVIDITVRPIVLTNPLLFQLMLCLCGSGGQSPCSGSTY